MENTPQDNSIPTIPVIPVQPVLVEKPVEKPEDLVKEWTARSNETGDEVYLMKDYYVIVKRTRRHITSPEALRQMGYELGQEKTIPFTQLQKYERLEPIDFQKPAEIPSAAAVEPEEKIPEVPAAVPPTIPPIVYQGNKYSGEVPSAS